MPDYDDEIESIKEERARLEVERFRRISQNIEEDIKMRGLANVLTDILLSNYYVFNVDRNTEKFKEQFEKENNE